VLSNVSRDRFRTGANSESVKLSLGVGRMRLGATLAVVCLLLSGCSVWSTRTSAPLQRKIGECAPHPCVAVDVSAMPELPGTVQPQARRLIEQELRKVLYAPLDVETDQYTPDRIERELQARLEEFKGISDAPIDWSLMRTAKVLFTNTEVTSVEVTNQGYLGGAHGFKERTLMTFDSRSGARLGVTDIINEKSQAVLLKVVEAEFRRARSIPTGQSLQDAGFFILPGQEMPLGENFALTDTFLEIHYNPYEVAPYSLGETSIRVPREAVEPLVKAELKPVFAAQSGSEQR
jgi:hypothetical protein